MQEKMDPFQILGINRGLSENADKVIKEHATSKLKELYGQIVKIIDSSDKSRSKKLDEIDKIIPDMFKYALAYKRVMTAHDRVEYNSNASTPLEEELKNVTEYFNKSTKIDEENTRGIQIRKNAYQILGMSDLVLPLKDEKKPDQGKGEQDPEVIYKNETVAKKAMLNISAVSRKDPEELEEILQALLKIRKQVWAYNKVNTGEKRRIYDYELKCQHMAEESENYKSSLLRVVRQQRKETIVVGLQEADGEPIMTLSEVGRLVNRGIFEDEGQVKEYKLEKSTKQGEKDIKAIYAGGINIDRLGSDPEYAGAIGKLLSNDNLISPLIRYLGGYIGNIKIQEDEKRNLKIEQSFDPVVIAMCRQYRKQERAKRRFESSTNETKTPNPTSPSDPTFPSSDDGGRE